MKLNRKVIEDSLSTSNPNIWPSNLIVQLASEIKNQDEELDYIKTELGSLYVLLLARGLESISEGDLIELLGKLINIQA